jgi:hypothetical protein
VGVRATSLIPWRFWCSLLFWSIPLHHILPSHVYVWVKHTSYIQANQGDLFKVISSEKKQVSITIDNIQNSTLLYYVIIYWSLDPAFQTRAKSYMVGSSSNILFLAELTGDDVIWRSIATKDLSLLVLKTQSHLHWWKQRIFRISQTSAWVVTAHDDALDKSRPLLREDT